MSERTNELGIRAALGATAQDIRRLVVGEGLRLAGVGILIGAVAALATSRLLSALAFRIGPLDLATLLVVPIVLALAMAIATFLPANRAARADPMRALRAE